MPGFGFSYPNSSFDFSMRQYVDVVFHVIEKLNTGPATLMFPCAWSYIAFQLAAEKPPLVERLIVSQCPCWDEEKAWSKRIDIGGMIGTPVIGQVFLALNPSRVSDSWYDVALPKGRATKEFSEPARKVLSNGGIFCLASLTQTWFHLKNPSFCVEQPTVVMWGGSDRTHRHSNPDSVLKYLKRGKVVAYPEAGHFPELEDPESLRNLLLDKELWNGLKTNVGDRGLENGPLETNDSKNNDDSTIRVIDDVVGMVPSTERRRPFDSHL
jgi:pimeloyl-ACP methyl ester carboxylesterase